MSDILIYTVCGGVGFAVGYLVRYFVDGGREKVIKEIKDRL